jgi:hypothetical protein
VLAYVFVELKGPLGSAGEAKLQNLTACYLGLRLHFHLAKLAKNADPDNFKHPSDAMSYSYGLRTGGGGSHWTLVAMKAAANSGEAGDLEVTRFVGVRGTQKGMLLMISPPTCSSVRLSAESYSPGRTPVRSFIVTILALQTVTTLWSGDVLDPAAILSFVLVLEAIRNQSQERLELVGNWLYCLRDRAVDPPEESSTRRKRSGKAPTQGSGSSTTKRPRRQEDFGADAGEGQSRDGGGDRGNVPNRATQTHASLFVDAESLDGTLKVSSPGSDAILKWAWDVGIASLQSPGEKVQLRPSAFGADLASSHSPLPPHVDPRW